jgi:NitT/TauT family transport system permease protein
MPKPDTGIHKQWPWLVGLLVAWEGIARLKLVNPMILPPASDVLHRLLMGIADGTLVLQWLQSVGLVMAGLLVGGLTGLLLACLDLFFPRTRPVLALFSSMLHPLPGVALLPLILAVAGIGVRAVFLVILHAVVWSAYLGMVAGFRQVEPHLVDVAVNMGATRLQMVRHVLLPVSAPQIGAALRIGWSRGWRALISAEMIFSAIGSLGGMGWYLFERRAFMDTKGLYAGIVLVILTGVLMENVVFARWVPDRPE